MPNHDPSAEHRLTDLALGLLAFLEEVSEYRAICIRAAPFTEISRGPGNALILATRYRCSKRDERLLARRVRAAEEWPSDLTIEDSSVVLLQTLSPPPAVRDLPSFPLRRVAQTGVLPEKSSRGVGGTPPPAAACPPPPPASPASEVIATG